ncbi:MAG TPA: serine--tRNA ligase [Candidatus Paceibacterota bacterium]|nr:serine--tRNA ligase [Candidatus Paceibacterota bacterium]
MLDITFIRENPDIVRAALKNKNREGIDLERILALADLRKVAAGAVSDINQKRGQAQAARDIEAGKRLKDELAAAEEKYKEIEKELVALLIKVPNIPSADTPVGPDESGNKVVRQWGDKPAFTFTPKAHWDIGKELGIIDTEKATEVSGARFTYLKGDLALMQFALIQLVMSVVTSRETLEKIIANAGLTVSSKPFVPMIVPVMVKKQVQIRMARFLTPEEHYLFPEDDTMLVGSAEHTLGPLHMDETLKEERLPLRYVGYSTAFRREAGAAGKDTRGILRQHQFDKVEAESFVRPEDGMAEQELLVAIQEYLLQQLKLPYQVVLVCTGDMGFPDQRQIDIETWMPGQDTYRETHSADYVGGFQARRLNTKIKRADGLSEPVHMNDATMIAIGRTLIAILENYQNEDGTVAIPEVLRPFMMGKEKIEKTA